jgi:protein O-mannosyl-transferase
MDAGSLPSIVDSKERRLYLAVVACALVPYVPALWNGFAMDDLYIIAWNPLVHGVQGIWRAFGQPYWPPDLGGQMYRPLPLATFALDWTIASGHPALFHLMNLLWHAGAAVVVAALALRFYPESSPSPGGRGGQGVRTAFVAGLIFAVHPVHVEAVANVIGLGELMAAVGVCLSVYMAVARQDVLWSGAFLLLGLLSKENAVVGPALIVWAWIVQLTPRPERRQIVAFVASWIVLGGAYLAVRSIVLHPYERLHATAPVFLGETALTGRLTAVAALADVARLLILPFTLRVDYSPAERTAVRSLFDARSALGLLCLASWVALLIIAWRRQRRVEAYGLGWIGIAFLPVSNLLFSSGVLLAERTLYLPSVGLALAAGAALARLPARRFDLALTLIVLGGAIRSAVRAPVWRDDLSVTESILTDSPKSYRGPARAAAVFQSHRQPARALEMLRHATAIYDRDPTLFIAGADAALTLGQSSLADSLLTRAEQMCFRCSGYYRTQALAARSRGDTAVADSLLARIR